MRAPTAALCALVGLFVMAPIASAHDVSNEKSNASCTLVDNVPTITLQVVFEGFAAADMPVAGTIALDGTTVKGPYTVPDFTGTHTETYAQATTPGAHTIAVAYTWPNQGASNGTTTKAVDCPAAAPPVTPPGGTPTPPGGGTLPESIASARARLRGPSGCVHRAFNARVSGRSIASVAFYVDGRLFKKFTGQRATYHIRVNPRRYGFGRHTIVAQVTFLAASGAPARSMKLTYRRCAEGAVSPRFTG